MQTDRKTDADMLADDKRLLADAIRDENTILNQRMSWALTLQGFLFASYFLADPTAGGAARGAVAWLGFGAGASSLIGSYFGNAALVSAIAAFERLQRESGGRSDVRPGARFSFAPTLLMPHFFIPIALMAVWGYVLGLQLGLL